MRTFDARSAVLSLQVSDRAEVAAPSDLPPRVDAGGEHPCAILQVVVRHQTPAVRPDDVLVALRQIGDLAPPQTPAVVRLAQGPLDGPAGTVSDPLAPDRGGIGG